MDYGMILSTFFIEVLFPILGAVILALVGIILKKIADKYDMQSLMDQQSIIEDLAISAIGYAEEKAATYAKNRTKLTGSEKLDIAVGFVLEKTPKVDRHEAKQWIEAMLARLVNVGATDDKVLREE
jgi:hypothetical protein